jgi:hypothetical protein
MEPVCGLSNPASCRISRGRRFTIIPAFLSEPVAPRTNGNADNAASWDYDMVLETTESWLII